MIPDQSHLGGPLIKRVIYRGVDLTKKDNGHGVLIPDHAPKVAHGVLQGMLCHNVLFFLEITLKRKQIFVFF